MTRIYFAPTKPKPHIPLPRRNHIKDHHHTDSDGKPTSNHKSNSRFNSNHGISSSSSSNCNHNSAGATNSNNLDPSAIEQIADGLEKMVLSWSHPQQYVISDDIIAGHHGNGDLSCGDVCDRDVEGGMFRRIIDREGNSSLISSDTIKSSTMELHEDGEFSIGTKETTISYIHQRDPHHLIQHHHMQHHQHGGTVEAVNASGGFGVSDMSRGRGGSDGVGDQSLFSVQNGQSCEAMEAYPSMGNGVWYLNPPLMVPNNATLFSGKVQENCGALCASMASGNNDDGNIENAGVENERVDLQRPSPRVSPASDRVLQKKRKAKPEKISCKLEVGEANSWNETIEINGGSKIKELLGKKLNTISNGITSLQGSNTPDMEFYKKKVEELQIALLECAMEYEVKIVEMKMEALQTKSHEQRIEPPKEKDSENNRKENTRDRHEAHRVEYLKKQLSRLQHEKAISARELSDLRKRERQFDLQRRSLDDALCRVNFLQSELAKKEQDILDCRLREKEAKAQLYELQLGLQKAQAAQIEPRKLLTLLPALKDWIQSSKKAHENTPDQPPIDNIVYAITKEIQMLQSALSHISNTRA